MVVRFGSYQSRSMRPATREIAQHLKQKVTVDKLPPHRLREYEQLKADTDQIIGSVDSDFLRRNQSKISSNELTTANSEFLRDSENVSRIIFNVKRNFMKNFPEVIFEFEEELPPILAEKKLETSPQNLLLDKADKSTRIATNVQSLLKGGAASPRASADASTGLEDM